jgi:DNA polymerase III delta prime subunit
MDLSKSIGNLTHHAYAIIGSKTTRSDLVLALETAHKISFRANPDFFDRTYETFTIDDAREVKTFHETRPMNVGAKKIFILSMDGITIEAQNALLKLLEEPAEYAHFFLIIPSAHLLLPTVKSRLHIVEGGHVGHPAVGPRGKAAREFLQGSASKRLDIIKDLMDEISKEKKNKQNAVDFLNDIEYALYEEKGVKKVKESLEAIEHARKYMNDRSPSVKMLLEYVALNI